MGPIMQNDSLAVTDQDHVQQLVHGFYAAVRADPLLGPVFEKPLRGRWDAHLQRMVDFWCTALKIERSFKGDVYKKHMALPDMQPQHLLRWLQLWGEHTAQALPAGLAGRAQDVAFGVARVMHLGWFGELPSREQLEQRLEEAALEAQNT